MRFRIALLIVALSTIVCVAPTTSYAQTITMKGSDTLGDEMVPKLAEAFRQSGSAATFNIEALGSSDAFKALLDGSAEIGMSSRPIKDLEKQKLADAGMMVQEHVAGVDMIAVIVNEKNDANNIPLDGVKMIFTGKVETWKRLAGEPPVKPYTRNETSGTFKVFQEIAMSGEEYGANTIKTGGNGEIAQNVANNLGGVGYVGLSYANAPGVKAVPVEGVTPDPANASTYPLSRKLFYYTIAGKTSPEAMKFIKWSQSSPEAAAIITEVGFIPAK